MTARNRGFLVANHEVWCATCDVHVSGLGRTPSEARRALTMAGWQRFVSWRCPICAAQERQKLGIITVEELREQRTQAEIKAILDG
jgi:hypothetical protein